MAVDQCDVLIAIGARFDDRVTGKVEAFAKNAQKIHIDIDPTAISKNVPADVPIVGDVKRVVKQLLELVKPLDTKDWLKAIDGWKAEHPLRYKQDGLLRTRHIIDKFGEITNGDAIVVSDVGQSQMWTHSSSNGNILVHKLHQAGWGRWVSRFPLRWVRHSGEPICRLFVSAATAAFR